MVEIVRKGELPDPQAVPECVRAAASAAMHTIVREPRPAGFALLFTSDLQLIEPAVAFLHEHAIQRAHTPDTVRTYTEILYDWFNALEQSRTAWGKADAVDLVSYRNRMLKQPSTHTHRAYSIRTVNHRVRGVLRFYEWAVRSGWLCTSPLIGRGTDFSLAARDPFARRRFKGVQERSFFVLRQFESLPRPLTSAQARDLLAELPPPYDLMARWQLYTGLRVSELLQLTNKGIPKHAVEYPATSEPAYRVINVIRKGRKPGYVIASTTLLEDTDAYVAQHRGAWLQRSKRRGCTGGQSALFMNRRGSAVKKNTFQQIIRRCGEACGFQATSHLMRATFACMLLARLQRLAKHGVSINPLQIVKILMGHEHIETTDKYLRAIAVDTHVLSDVLDSLIPGSH